jgi:hypothetical protein
MKQALYCLCSQVYGHRAEKGTESWGTLAWDGAKGPERTGSQSSQDRVPESQELPRERTPGFCRG